MKITFLGTRGSVSAAGKEYTRYGGDTPCVMVQAGDELILMDAGTGILRMIQYIDLTHIKQIHILLSHPHIDHITGMMFFNKLFNPGIRVDVHGKRRMGMGVYEQIKRLMSPPLWPVSPDIFQKDVHYHDEEENVFWIGDVKTEMQEMIHPGGCTAYKLSHNGATFVYATDTEYNKNIPEIFLEFTKGCNLLVIDGQFGDAEYSRRLGWGHSSREIGIWLATHNQIQQVKLFHHDLKAVDEILEDADREIRSRVSNCSLAKQGEAIVL